jgi:Epoxide hydrolase N terminus
MTGIHPFRIDVPDETLDRIRARVAEFPWHEMPDDGGWAYGTNLDYMKELCAYTTSPSNWAWS